MRQSPSLFAYTATIMVAFFFFAAVLIIPDFATAADPAANDPAAGIAREDTFGKPAGELPGEPPAATTPADERGEKNGEQTGSCSCPETFDKSKVWPRPKFAGLSRRLDTRDEIAALESVQLALAEVGDGSSYVWHRYHGHLSGVVTPTVSFRDGSGNVCRHLVVILSSGTRSKRSEGIACRLDNGRWQLQG